MFSPSDKVHKVTVHAGFTCPNRDGKVAVGGCIYCVNQSFSPVAGKSGTPIQEQMRKGIKFLRKRSGAQKFIAYFQPFSNTYADVGTLKRRYDEALCDDDVVGISIGYPDWDAPENRLRSDREKLDEVSKWYGFE